MDRQGWCKRILERCRDLWLAGAAGATGAQGPQGPTGATGATGTSAVVANADIFRTSDITVNVGTAIPFNASDISGSGITFTNGNSTIQLGANMRFYVRYTVTSTTGIPFAVGLRLNGAAIHSSLASTQAADTSISNAAIFSTGNAGGILDLFVFFNVNPITVVGIETSLQIIRLA